MGQVAAQAIGHGAQLFVDPAHHFKSVAVHLWP